MAGGRHLLTTLIATLLVIPDARAIQPGAVPAVGCRGNLAASNPRWPALMHRGLSPQCHPLIPQAARDRRESCREAYGGLLWAGALTLGYVSRVRFDQTDVKGRLVFDHGAKWLQGCSLGMGAFAAAVFHLIHGLLKSALFLGAWDQMGSQDRPGNGHGFRPSEGIAPFPRRQHPCNSGDGAYRAIVASRVLPPRYRAPVACTGALQAPLFSPRRKFRTNPVDAFRPRLRSWVVLPSQGLTFDTPALIDMFDTGSLKFGPAPAAVGAWWLLIRPRRFLVPSWCNAGDPVNRRLCRSSPGVLARRRKSPHFAGNEAATDCSS
jgi:hypothetical protein